MSDRSDCPYCKADSRLRNLDKLLGITDGNVQTGIEQKPVNSQENGNE